MIVVDAPNTKVLCTCMYIRKKRGFFLFSQFFAHLGIKFLSLVVACTIVVIHVNLYRSIILTATGATVR